MSHTSRFEQSRGRQMFLVTTRAFEGEEWPEPVSGATDYALPVVHVLSSGHCAPFVPPFGGERGDIVGGGPELCYSPVWHPEDRTFTACRINGRLYVCPNEVEYCNLRYYEADGRTRWVRDFAEQTATIGAQANLRVCVIPGDPDQIYAGGDRVTRTVGDSDEGEEVSWCLARYDTDGNVVWRLDLKHSVGAFVPASGNVLDIVTDGTFLYCLVNHSSGDRYIIQVNQSGGIESSVLETSGPYFGGLSTLMFGANGFLYGAGGSAVVASGSNATVGFTEYPESLNNSMGVGNILFNQLRYAFKGIANAGNGDILFVLDYFFNPSRELWVYDSTNTLKWFDDFVGVFDNGARFGAVAGDSDGNIYLSVAAGGGATGVQSIDGTGILRWSAGDLGKTSLLIDGAHLYCGGPSSSPTTIEKRLTSDGSLLWKHDHIGVQDMALTSDGVVAATSRDLYTAGTGSYL